MYKILFADDQAIMRDAVGDMLRKEPDVAAVSLATDGAHAVDLCRTQDFHAVVLDIAMPVLNGIQALGVIKQIWPGLPVVMLSTRTDAYTVRHCLQLGALGYVAKESTSDELIKAIRACVAGEPYLCRVVKESLDASGA